MKITKERLMTQYTVPTINTLKQGDMVSVKELIMQERCINGECSPNDSLICKVKSGSNQLMMRIPMREFLKMKDKDGNPSFVIEEGGQIVTIASLFTVSKVEKRFINDMPCYPIKAYKYDQKYYDNLIGIAELYASGLKADFGGCEQKCDYTIVIH